MCIRDRSGTFDPELEIAVRSAQRYFGLAETGEVSPATWTIFRDAALTLLAVTPAAAGPEPGGEWPASALALGSAGPAVLQVQQWLNPVSYTHLFGGWLALHGLGFLGISLANPIAWGFALCYCAFMVTRMLRKEDKQAAK